MSNKDNEQSKIHKTMLRNKIITSSSKEISEKGINIKEEILNILKEEGFDIEESGTKYLASLTALLFHERKLYQKLHKRESYQDYWNLSDDKNEHYQMLGASSRQVINAMKASIAASDKSMETIPSLIFNITDNLVQSYDKEEAIIKYQKMIKK